MQKILAALTGTALLLAASGADATVFDFTYTGGGVSGTGTLNTKSIAPGEFEVLSGTDRVSGGSVNGTLALFANPSASSVAFSPTGYFTYDNLLFTTVNPIVGNAGLLFTNSAGAEVNVFSNGPGAYVHYDSTGFNVPVSFALTEVPEPASIALLGLGLVGLGLVRQRRS